MHGRDHGPNGADPIPGIGTGGGALDWEDVGTVVPVAANLQTPHAIYRATSLVLTAGGTWSGYAPVWATLWSSYLPEGSFLEIDTADASGKTLRYTVPGTYLCAYWFHANGGVPTDFIAFWEASGDIIPPSIYGALGQILPGSIPVATLQVLHRVTTVGASVGRFHILGTMNKTAPTDVTASIVIQQLSKV